MHHNMSMMQQPADGAKKGGKRAGKAGSTPWQRLEAINKSYVEGLKEVKALLHEGVLSAEEFEREKQGLLKQRDAQVLHHQQQAFALAGPQGGGDGGARGVDGGVADALAAPPSFASAGVAGKGGGAWMPGASGSNDPPSNHPPVSTSAGRYEELLARQHEQHALLLQHMLHAAPSAGPKRVRPSKTQKAASQASQASQASLESHHTALASWEGAVPACGAVGGGALPASAWASGWGASGPCAAAAPGSALASAPASAPALASPAMYAGMWSGMGGGEVLAMQQHMSMVQHPQALAKAPRKARAKKGEKAARACSVAAGNGGGAVARNDDDGAQALTSSSTGSSTDAHAMPLLPSAPVDSLPHSLSAAAAAAPPPPPSQGCS
eukprot:Tamp_08927.p1 GENE.Tamp_08927~~Tamp_08927.p1  ORF type:complete len:382 (-),score=77.64 Tamp_08927:68-1213(-)